VTQSSPNTASREAKVRIRTSTNLCHILSRVTERIIVLKLGFYLLSHQTSLMTSSHNAFDSINHPILARKLDIGLLHLPDHIYSPNWIINFLTDRTQSVVLNGEVSNKQTITQSIVQGSGIGPVLYTVYSSDGPEGRTLF